MVHFSVRAQNGSRVDACLSKDKRTGTYPAPLTLSLRTKDTYLNPNRNPNHRLAPESEHPTKDANPELPPSSCHKGRRVSVLVVACLLLVLFLFLFCFRLLLCFMFLFALFLPAGKKKEQEKKSKHTSPRHVIISSNYKWPP